MPNTVATLIVGPFEILTELSMNIQIQTIFFMAIIRKVYFDQPELEFLRDTEFRTVVSKQNAKTDPPVELIKIIGTFMPNLGLQARIASSAAILFAEISKFHAR